jgi:hypothetical protein
MLMQQFTGLALGGKNGTACAICENCFGKTCFTFIFQPLLSMKTDSGEKSERSPAGEDVPVLLGIARSEHCQF